MLLYEENPDFPTDHQLVPVNIQAKQLSEDELEEDREADEDEIETEGEADEYEELDELFREFSISLEQ